VSVFAHEALRERLRSAKPEMRRIRRSIRSKSYLKNAKKWQKTPRLFKSVANSVNLDERRPILRNYLEVGL
jgi:hypothetical protein